MAGDNKMLGEFDLVGIPPAARGTPQIEVTFDIDASGIVNVSARDKATGKEQAITIASSGGLSKEDMERMVQDAERFQDDDIKRKEFAENKNQAETLIFNTEKSLNEHKAACDEATVTHVNEAIEKARAAVNNEDMDALKPALEALNKAATKIGEAVYKNKGNSSSSSSSSSSSDAGKEKENVVDAEYETKKN